MSDETLTYPDAPDHLIRQWNRRRGPLSFAPGESLPPLDCDLAALARRRLPATASPLPEGASGHAQKRHELQADLAGQSELALLNGLLIAHLRKRRYPAHVPALFHRIWREQGTALMQDLSPRWLISSLISFAEAGTTEEERSLAREMGMLFSLMKLYEFERLHSGSPPDKPFALRQKVKADLPMGMPPFSLVSGGLDINLLAPLWDRAQRLDVLGPLACHLLDRLNGDPGTLFRRIAAMRSRKRARIEARQAQEG
ncbi:hypothetical protein [Szabonella alba]|uniref:Uncharacterized protein n=1 Tax=Szabonella alba TaxID=2804194 RepID=A0A8K0Y0Z1_9RHOB|nr:hypothetical protein [Szabonella alba]MBL4917342.1 hypothetical protein [Szabonella alba]